MSVPLKAHHSCAVCGRERPSGDLVGAELLREAVVETLHRHQPAWSGGGPVCHRCLDAARSQYVQDALEQERGELSALDQEVVRTIQAHTTISADTNAEFEAGSTLGQRVADGMATVAGSWGFIIGFGLVLASWIALNALALLGKPFDPYPYILLNLVLSCMAAVQAPIIMMSQNRQEARDRLHAEHDYQVNLKAELEIKQLHEKIDHIMVHQWQRLTEIQQIQVDLMNELVKKQ